MSLRYLPEHVPQVVQSLSLARKEAEHLRYSQTTLFAMPLDRAWVQALSSSRPWPRRSMRNWCAWASPATERGFPAAPPPSTKALP
jgi:hypothetical protein